VRPGQTLRRAAALRIPNGSSDSALIGQTPSGKPVTQSTSLCCLLFASLPFDGQKLGWEYHYIYNIP